MAKDLINYRLMKVTDNLRVTLVQADLVWEDPALNRLNLERLILRMDGETDVVFLPETFTTGFSVQTESLAEPMNGPTIDWLLSLTKKANLAIGGSLLIREDERFFNRFVFIKPDGGISFYDKRHLFSIGGESDTITAGDQRVVVNYLGWRIALYICYDLRFPVWCRNTADTDLMIFSANWPDSRREVWNTLLKARAIENQVYVAGVNRIGTDGEGLTYRGDSQMINARGEVMAINAPVLNELLTYRISKQELTDFRDKFPVAKDADHFLID